MLPFRIHTGRVAPLVRPNVDTDQIIPKQFLKRVERTGFGQFLFYDWRHTAAGELDPTFVLNAPRYRDASVLVAGRNFGCGSSREHAPWALLDYGFRVVVAPSFADIFANNCLKNGVVPVVLSEAEVSEIARRAALSEDYALTVDLERCEVRDRDHLRFAFEIDEFRRHCLLEGLDDIGLTLRHESNITDYEARRPLWREFQTNSPTSS
ncbi:MAG: 3-isopropylmalate/(R)-2-methylmalate dehydratase small subunit [Acidobacteriota bacterium]|jgi:3-isopropylmalate/(R)-2-methylmalate dehydratase small subunit|nr:3-isopropylmalate/(R)-2-methylmalate dehydratase small subunit [Acidobacteriota bacterium]